MDATAQDKLNAEVEKLRLEAKALRNPFRTSIFWLSVSSTILAVGVALYQLKRSGLDKREARINLLETEMAELNSDAEQFRKLSSELAHLVQNKTKLQDLQKPGSELGNRLRPLFFPVTALLRAPKGFPKGAKVTTKVTVLENGAGTIALSASGFGHFKKTPQFVVQIYDLEHKRRLQEIPVEPMTTKISKVFSEAWSVSISKPIELNADARLAVLLPSQIELE